MAFNYTDDKEHMKEVSRQVEAQDGQNVGSRARWVKADGSVIWVEFSARDVVGGDIYWMKTFREGSVLCVADCTGHGTPGALLTMLVVSALDAVVKDHNCRHTADIIWKLEQRLVNVLNIKSPNGRLDRYAVQDGCDLAVLFLVEDGGITLSAGHTNVFVCDGKDVTTSGAVKYWL